MKTGSPAYFRRKPRQFPFRARLAPGGILAWIVIGLLGAAIGGLLFSLFGSADRAGFWESVAVATLGAIVLLALARTAGRPRR